ncbi:MAG TPA: nodulation protein NfeD [Anaerolineales bacterium]|nr:nodulation protein NfeD [Anaerolineales bacterium]
MPRLALFASACALLLAARPAGSGQPPAQPEVLLLSFDGPLTPALAEYLDRGLTLADQNGADLVVLQLNTPGGSIDVMNRMVQSIRGSSVPVAVYVAPRGAMAGSAGTILVLAGHVAAMAPETAIGAASPVGAQGEDLGETLAAKTQEILKATVRSLAAWRGERAIEMAESAIEQAAAASADEALAAKMIDVVAKDIDDLLRQLDGRSVVLNGSPVVLHLESAETQPVRPTVVEQLLQALTNPNLVFLLLSLGVQALLIEISSPGGWVAGFIGISALALGAYGLGILPVNWFGLVFLALAFALFVVDIKAPTHGALTLAGLGSFILGALVLFNSPGTPSFQRVSVPLVVTMGALMAGMFFVLLTFVLRAQRRPMAVGTMALVGKIGEVRQRLAPRGQVQVAGELWAAEIDLHEPAIEEGARVEVTGVEGLRLRVRPWERKPG